MWVLDSIAAANTIVGGVNTGIADGACDAPAITPPFHNLPHVGIASDPTYQLPAPSGLGCTVNGGSSGQTAGNLFGFRTVVRDVLSLILWLGVFLIGWRMMPWSRRGDGAEVVAGPASGGELEGASV
jgi:hypothetical protein